MIMLVVTCPSNVAIRPLALALNHNRIYRSADPSLSQPKPDTVIHIPTPNTPQKRPGPTDSSESSIDNILVVELEHPDLSSQYFNHADCR